jgi:tetratricopeptide (TPR) repeat protein
MQCANAIVLEIVGGDWEFSHDKLREAVLIDIPDGERAELHRKVAQGIEAIYPGDEAYITVLANHYHQAGIQEKEIHYALLDAKSAYRLGDTSRAQQRVEQVIELIHPDTQEYLIAMILLGRINTRMGQYERAADLFESLLTHDLAIEMRVEILQERVLIFDRTGNYEEGSAFARQALDLLGDFDRSERYGRLLNMASLLAIRQGNPEEARHLIEKAREIATELDNQEFMADILVGLGRVSYGEGNYELAEIHSLEAISILNLVRDRESEAKALGNLGVFMWAAGSYVKARNYTEQSLELAWEIHSQYLLATNQNTLAYLLMEMGEQQAAEAAFREAIGELKNQDNLTILLDSLIGLSTLRSKQGQTTWAAEVLAMVQAHPAMSWDVQQSIDPLLEDLQGKISEEDFEGAMERGKALDMDAIIAEFLAGSDVEPD